MDCARNIITANFSGGTSATTAPLWQWDYGQVLCITGIEDLPAAFEVHFSTNRTGGVSTTAVGADGQVTIPNVLLTIGKNLNAWIYLSDTQGEGETEYSILIPVKARPMPETYDAEVSGEFDDVVRQVSEYAETAQTAADNAGASASAAATSASEAAASASAAETAKNAAETAQGNAEGAQAAAETAAQTATEKAQQTAQDAAQAALDAGRAESAAGSAEAAQTGAESAKTDAGTAAQGAADSASAASASASSAGQAATSAAQSATAAAGSATTAQGAAQTATTKAGEASASATAAAASETAAQTAQAGAEAAKDTAVANATTATTKAAEAAQSASNAAASETAAEAAATRAETAAASLTVDSALSDSSVNPVQNKVITESVTQVKSAITKLTPAATDADVGKALIVKAVADGKPTEYEYGEAGGGGGTVDDVLSDTSTNPVQNRVITGAIRALQITDTASGAIVSIPDGSANPIQSLSVSISPIQEGSGDPSPDNIRPITGRDSVTVERTMLNLLPLNLPSNAFAGQFGTNSTSIASASNARCWCVYVGKNADLRYSCAEPGAGLAIAFADKMLTSRDGAVIYDALNMINRGNAMLNSGEHSYLVCSASNINQLTPETGGFDIHKAMLTFGTETLPYAPRRDIDSITVQLGQTVYGGTVDFTTGVMTVTSALKHLSDLSWTANASANTFNGTGFTERVTRIDGSGDTGCYCDTYAWYTSSTVTDYDYGIALANTSSSSLNVRTTVYVKDIRYSTVNEFIASFATHDPVVVCPLATPTALTLDPATLSTLKGQNNVWSDGDSVDVTYIADPKLYIDKKITAAVAALA